MADLIMSKLPKRNASNGSIESNMETNKLILNLKKSKKSIYKSYFILKIYTWRKNLNGQPKFSVMAPTILFSKITNVQQSIIFYPIRSTLNCSWSTIMSKINKINFM